MCFQQQNPITGQSTQVQKGIQAVLAERGLWPHKGVRLACERPKCTSCQAFTTCIICVKGQRCDSCKKARNHSGNCTKQRICDACDFRKKQCQCVTKKYCLCCKEISLQKSCLECNKIPPRCTLEGEFLNSQSVIIFLLI